MSPAAIDVANKKITSSSEHKKVAGKGDAEVEAAPGLTPSSSSESTGTVHVEPLPIVYSKEEGAVEPVTGFRFPATLNGHSFVACGVRTMYIFIHAYAVGIYLETEVKPEDDVESLLLDPAYPKIFRLVMNRDVTSKQYLGAIFTTLTPLMRGQDMDKLEQLRDQDLPNLLNKGTEILLMVKENKLILQCGDRAGEVTSMVLARAICENYFGKKPVSPAAKKACFEALEKLASGK